VQQLHKVLGVSWELKSDELLPLVDLEVIVPKKFTKQEVLSCLSKIYDPCGLVSPAVTPLKIIVQDCWKEKLGWDEEVNPDLRRVERVVRRKPSESKPLVGNNTLSVQGHKTVTSRFL